MYNLKRILLSSSKEGRKKVGREPHPHGQHRSWGLGHFEETQKGHEEETAKDKNTEHFFLSG